MSTFIPMVSSSPPPLDDALEDDEFGGFATAPPAVPAKSDKFGDFAAFTEVIKDTKVDDSKSHFKPVTDEASEDWMNDEDDGEGFDDFTKAESPRDAVDDTVESSEPSVDVAAEIETEQQQESSTTQQENLSDCDRIAASDDEEEEKEDDGEHEEEEEEVEEEDKEATGAKVANEKPSNLELDSCCPTEEGNTVQRLNGEGPIESPLSEESQDTKPDQRPQKPDSQDTTSQGSMTDSGLCSDISPVPKFEDYPDFVERKISEGDLSESQSESEIKTPHCCDSAIVKEQSPGPNAEAQNSKDSDSGHGVEIGELPLPASTESSPEAEDNDISPNEETLVTGSVSDYQLQEAVFLEDDDGDTDPDADADAKPSEPEPLHFKTPSFSQDELEEMSEKLDDSFGQFPPPTCAATESEEETVTPNKEASDADSTASQEASASASSEDASDQAKSKQALGSKVQDSKDTEDTSHIAGEESQDFDDFKSSAVSSKENTSTKNSGDEEEDAGDDFDDFKAGGSTEADEWAAFGDDNTPTNDEKGGEDDWAAFQEPPVAAAAAADDGEEDDDFGEFGDATSGTAVTSSASSSPSLTRPEKKLERALCGCFPEKASDDDDDSASLAVDLLRESVILQTLRTQEVPDSPRKGLPGHESKPKKCTVDIGVWNNLKDLEKTCALDFQWAKSFNNQRLLKSLSIDTRNILIGHKRQSVPIFASQLGMLEPSRGPAKKEEESIPQPAIVDTKPAPVVTTPIDIPPAEFDWTRSGLTNPLDVLQKEQEILQAIEPSPGEPPKMLEPLENLLANMKFTPTAPPTVGKKNEETELGAEAQDVIQVLRDFSFMHATVLMFPYKEFGE